MVKDLIYSICLLLSALPAWPQHMELKRAVPWSTDKQVELLPHARPWS